MLERLIRLLVEPVQREISIRQIARDSGMNLRVLRDSADLLDTVYRFCSKMSIKLDDQYSLDTRNRALLFCRNLLAVLVTVSDAEDLEEMNRVIDGTSEILYSLMERSSEPDNLLLYKQFEDIARGDRL